MTRILLDRSLPVRPETVEYKGILVKTTVPMSAYMFVHTPNASSGTFLMETRHCGKHYIVPSITTGLIALHDNTRVDYHTIYKNASVSVNRTEVLNRLQTFVISKPVDVSNVFRISSSQPICLFYYRQYSGGLTVIMSPPTDQFSSGFILPKFFKMYGTTIGKHNDV